MAQRMFFFFNLQIRNLIVVSADDIITSCSPGNPLDEIRSIIDRDIARLEESIRSLKTSISRLPAEILCNIFSLLEGNTVYGRPETLVKYHNIGDQQLSARRNSGPIYLLATLAGYRKC